jgi:anti-sigma regulatory factor (Ser/Thr protein kinase)
VPDEDTPGARHRALIYEDAGRLVEVASAFVRDGVHRHDRVLVGLTPEKQGWLREALGDLAPEVEWADAHALYARQGPMLRSVIGFLARDGTPGSGRARIVAEQPLQARSDSERREYMRYEAAANVAYEPFAASVLCPYDANALPEAVLSEALHTHPEVIDHGRRARFVDPREFVRTRSTVPPPPAGAPAMDIEGLGDLARVRAWLNQRATAFGLDPTRLEDLEVAATEVVTNSLRHGSAPRRLWLYTREALLVCHVIDGGDGLADPLAGYLQPDLLGEGGRGLWIARQLCDVVETVRNGSGFHVCLAMRL